MSFVRLGRPQQQTKGKRPARQKKTAAPKKEWVSTVSDLSVHKLSPAELSHRHEIRKSHNKAAAQWELREKALMRRLRHPGSPAPLDHASLRIIREVFSDQLLLQDVLARSDRAMADVKDLFGDAPRRQEGHPSVTMAPNCDSDLVLPVLQRPDPPTQLSLLSQSMMDQQALNEVEAPEEEYSDQDISPSGSSEDHVIRRANLQKMRPQSCIRAKQKVRHPSSDQPDRDSVPVTPCTSGRAPDERALNATVAVQRVRSRQGQSEEGREETSVLVSQVLNPELPSNQSGGNSNRKRRTRKCVSHSLEFDGSSLSSVSGHQSSLGLLQAMLDQVETDLDTLSPSLEAASAQNHRQSKAQSFTGFSVALVSTLGRVVQLFKQKEEGAQREAHERRRLEEELREQRGLIDALTAETMTLREEAAALQVELLHRISELEQKLETVLLVMGGQGIVKAHINPPKDSSVKAAAHQTAPTLDQHLEPLQPSVSPAVLLSPPQQRSNWQQIPAWLDQGSVSVNNRNPYEDPQAHSSVSSPSSLPLASIPSASSSSVTSDALRSCISPEALLAEITLLSKQNDLIKTQLNQVKSLRSSVRESPDSSSSSIGHRRLSPTSTERVTSTSAGARRLSVCSITERSQHGGEQPNPQVSPPNSVSLSSVEQRLLELNRESAAARGRLLELIEQQRQSVSNFSSSGSPVSPFAVSPHSAGSPEELQSQTSNVERRSSGSEVLSCSLGGGPKHDKAEIKKRSEGWFALSSHVR